MENNEYQPKSQSTLEKVQISGKNFTKLEKGIIGVGVGAAIAFGANTVDKAFTPVDFNKEINSPNKIVQPGTMPSQSMEFTPKVVNPNTGRWEQGGPKSIDEIKTVAPLTPDEQQKADAIKKAEKVKAEMELKAGIRKYKEEVLGK